MVMKYFPIVIVVLANFADFSFVVGQVPLGLHKYDPKIYFPEFFSYGKRMVPILSSKSNSGADQFKFRRHAKIETIQRRNGDPESSESEEDSIEPQKAASPDSFMKMLRRDYDLFGNAMPKPKGRGKVTFLSKHKDIGEELRTLSIKGKLGLDDEESPVIEKRIRTVKRRIANPKIQLDQNVELIEVLSPSKEELSNRLSVIDRAFEDHESYENYRNDDQSFENFYEKKNNLKFPVGEPRPRKPLETLIPEQYQRVLSTATALNIPTGIETRNFQDEKQFIVVSPKGSPDAGSLAYVRIKPESDNGQIKTSYNFNIMRGPYDDIYHRQLINDLHGVSAILGRSAKFTALPDMNSVLSKIELNSNWDIKRLR